MSLLLLAGQPRNGTSMMMRILKMGGVDIEYDEKLDTPVRHKILGNPHGFFETKKPSGTKTFKVLRAEKLKEYSDSKVIFIYRDINQVVESWKKAKRVVPRAMIEANRKSFLSEVNKHPHIIIKYEDMRKNPYKECKKIRDFLGEFNIENAVKAIDPNI